MNAYEKKDCVSLKRTMSQVYFPFSHQWIMTVLVKSIISTTLLISANPRTLFKQDKKSSHRIVWLESFDLFSSPSAFCIGPHFLPYSEISIPGQSGTADCQTMHPCTLAKIRVSSRAHVKVKGTTIYFERERERHSQLSKNIGKK